MRYVWTVEGSGGRWTVESSEEKCQARARLSSARQNQAVPVGQQRVARTLHSRLSSGGWSWASSNSVLPALLSYLYFVQVPEVKTCSVSSNPGMSPQLLQRANVSKPWTNFNPGSARSRRASLAVSGRCSSGSLRLSVETRIAKKYVEDEDDGEGKYCRDVRCLW